jgi:hypothetical protein
LARSTRAIRRLAGSNLLQARDVSRKARQGIQNHPDVSEDLFELPPHWLVPRLTLAEDYVEFRQEFHIHLRRIEQPED